MPSIRKSGNGGHHPCRPCCSKNETTTPGRMYHFLLTEVPNSNPPKASEEAFTSNVFSISHSFWSSFSRWAISCSDNLLYSRIFSIAFWSISRFVCSGEFCLTLPVLCAGNFHCFNCFIDFPVYSQPLQVLFVYNLAEHNGNKQ